MGSLLLSLCFYQSSKLDADLLEFGRKNKMEYVGMEILNNRKNIYKIKYIDENKKIKTYIVTGVWSVTQAIEVKE